MKNSDLEHSKLEEIFGELGTIFLAANERILYVEGKWALTILDVELESREKEYDIVHNCILEKTSDACDHSYYASKYGKTGCTHCNEATPEKLKRKVRVLNDLLYPENK